MDKVRALVADQSQRFTFFCGGARNFSTFLDLFDGVFVLEIDLDTLNRRLDQRPKNEFGTQRSERNLIVRLHRTREGICAIEQAVENSRECAPELSVVGDIVRSCRTAGQR